MPPESIAAVAAIASGLAAIAAAIVAWRSTEIERTKVKLALYDRRFACYRATLDLIRDAIQRRDWPEEIDVAFLAQWEHAKFLFPAPVADEMNKVRMKIIDLGFHRDMWREGSPEEKREHGKELVELVKFLRSKYQSMAEVFQPYARLLH